MYFTMNDRYAQAAMNSLSFNSGKVENRTVLGQSGAHFCETLPQPAHLQALTKPLKKLTERAGFEPAVPAKGTPVFETGSISHSDTSPSTRIPSNKPNFMKNILLSLLQLSVIL
jgi:hypothetical protein